MDQFVIAIDGLSGVGKSTLGKALARHFGFLYIDSGALYRAVGRRALDTGVPLDDPIALTRAAREADIRFEGDADHLRVLLDGRDVTTELRTPEASRASSVVATIAGVREAVVEKLRAMSRSHGVVMDGRDIGTKVFPDARIKLFLEAAPAVRAQRRYLEERQRRHEVTLEEIGRELEERDRRDRERSATPLVPAADAILIDTSDLDLQGVIERVLEIVKSRS